MIGWSIEESGHDLSHMASYNLWNTTLPLPGSTVFNFANVQNYTSYNQGVTANASTIRNGLYPSLLRALQTNDCASLGVTGVMSPGVASDLSVWVSGQRTPTRTDYTGVIIAVARQPGNAANDTAAGNASTVTPGTPVTGTAMSANQPTATSTPSGNPLDTTFSILNFLADPSRILKIIGGLLCIGVALFLLISPTAAPVNAVVNKTTGFVKKVL